MENHREALLEHDGAGGFSLELPCGQSKVFANLGPNAPGHFTPTAPDSLEDLGVKRNALAQACPLYPSPGPGNGTKIVIPSPL